MTARARDAAVMDVRFGPDGLAPAIVQDAEDGRVLMLAYVDAEALTATLTTGEVHFHSRSRDRLWRKGETSGNVLRLRDLALDCDGDALLLTVDPVGPTCHRGTRSCFDAVDESVDGADDRLVGGSSDRGSSQGFGWLEMLWSTIDSRATERPPGSYTAELLDGGVDAVGRKVSEEATEVLIAAKDDATAELNSADRAGTRAALAGEAADQFFHLLVALRERQVTPSAVIDVLRERHSG